MPKLNVQQNNQGVIQALKNALAIGQINGTLQCDGANNFSAGGGGGGGGVDLGITGATVGQVPVVASVNGSGAPTSWTPTTPSSGDTSLGITGASAGEYAKIKTVDANGVPTAWESGSGGGGGSSVDPATAAPLMDGTAAVGTSTKYAREDHVHPTDTSRAAASHVHSASDITSGTLGVARGGTGTASFTANSVVMSGTTTTGALTTRSVTNNTSSTAVPANTNIPTCNTVKYGLDNKLNRSTAVNAADTGYTTYMARGEALNSADTTPTVNGAISWTYE